MDGKEDDKNDDKNDIIKLIREKSARITYKELQRTTKYPFKKVFLDDKYTEYAQCTTCSDIYIVKYVTGSNGIINHMKGKHSNKSKHIKVQKSIDFYGTSELTADEKKQIARAAAVCASTDLLPLSFAEKPGLRHFIDVILKVSRSKKGLLDPKQILPSHPTVMKNIVSIQAEIKESIKNDLVDVDAIHTTCDHWKEDYTNRDFFTVTIHYVSPDNDDSLISSAVLATIETSCKTAAQIKIDFDSVIDQFDIREKIKTVVTDNASANKKAFQFRTDLDWLSCKAHDLNLVLKHSFEFKESDKDRTKLSDVCKLIKSSKDLVTYIKQAGINSVLNIALKQSVETRWDSTLDQLESIQSSFQQLQSLSESIPDLKEKLLTINKQLMDEIVALLIPFRVSRQKLCRNSVPTLHEVAVVRQYLLNEHLKSHDSDLSLIKDMKARLSKNVIEYFDISVHHILASYLTPGLKSDFIRNYSDQTMVSAAKEHLRGLYKDCDDLSDTTDTIEIPMKKSKPDDMFSVYYKCSDTQPRNQLTEIQKYHTRLVSDKDVDENPLKFWNRSEINLLFPKISKIAKEVLSIPATSVKSEQNFSAAGRLINDRRSHLKSSNIDAILFDRSNIARILEL